jgi:hypothetical protein
MGEHGIKSENKTVPDFDCTDGLSILDENVSKVNDFLEVLRARG